MGKVSIYAGKGATRARDVDVALDRMGIPYRKVDEHAVRKTALEGCSLLIVPGGRTEEIIEALGPNGLEKIRKFVSAGDYVGLCAGAYIAAERVEVPRHPSGLGIINYHEEPEEGWKTPQNRSLHEAQASNLCRF